MTHTAHAPAPLRLGILSTAKIARSFVSAVSRSSLVKVSAVASRDTDTARQFAADLTIAQHYGSYEALLADPDIDAIYNALPNSMHAEWSMQALRAGKHVLCEKPLATSASEARDMYAAAAASNRLLVEGYPYLAQPQTIELLRIAGSGELGRPRMIQAAFGFTMADADNIRLNPNLGGGALMDAGSYPVSLVRMLSGALPAHIDARASWDIGGVDTALVANLAFPDGLLAQISCTFQAGVHRHALIAFEHGAVMTTFSNHTGPDMPATLMVKRGTGWDDVFEPVTLLATNGFLAEAESFAQAITKQGEWQGISPAQSIDVASMIEAIRNAAQSHIT